MVYRLTLYTINVIRTFRDKEAEKLFRDEFSRRYQAIENTARRKLVQLDQARTLADLSALPGNRLETLKGDRRGQHSLRINNQFRVCFVWTGDGNAEDVEIVDYH